VHEENKELENYRKTIDGDWAETGMNDVSINVTSSQVKRGFVYCLKKLFRPKTIRTARRCHRLSLPGGLSLPEAVITIAGTNPNPEP